MLKIIKLKKIKRLIKLERSLLIAIVIYIIKLFYMLQHNVNKTTLTF